MNNNLKFRLNWAINVLNRAVEMAREIDDPAVIKLTEILSQATLLIPTADGDFLLKEGNSNLAINILLNEDKQYPYLSKFFESGIGTAAPSGMCVKKEGQTIILLCVGGIYSVDYLATVLIHEGVHALQTSCSKSDWDCISLSELQAHLVHFALLDYLGAKSKRYFEGLRDSAEAAKEFYILHGHAPNPEYKNARKMRKIFQSSNEYQDNYWYTIYYFRRNFEMFCILYDRDMEKACLGFRRFLVDAYKASFK